MVHPTGVLVRTANQKRETSGKLVTDTIHVSPLTDRQSESTCIVIMHPTTAQARRTVRRRGGERAVVGAGKLHRGTYGIIDRKIRGWAVVLIASYALLPLLYLFHQIFQSS